MYVIELYIGQINNFCGPGVEENTSQFSPHLKIW